LTLLAANLKNNTGLTAGNSIDNAGAALMAGLLVINTSLTVLKVNTSLRYLGWRQDRIGKRRQSQISKNQQAFEKPVLDNATGNEGAAALGEALRINSTLTFGATSTLKTRAPRRGSTH
jgi:hypothetical protein